MKPFPSTSEFLRAARRVIWFKSPEEALANPVELLAYAMRASTDEDMALLLEHVGYDGLTEAIDQAPPGMLGLETALALALTELDLPLAKVLALMSWQPARIANIAEVHGTAIAAGNRANLAIIDPDVTWVVRGDAMASKSRNTPFEGRTLRGRVRHTVLHGEPVVVDGEAQR